MDDQALIQQIRRRDQDAMVILYQRYVNLAYSIAYRVLDNEAAAEECVQDAFMKVWQNAGQFDPARGSFAGWLVQIIRHTAIDSLRRRNGKVSTVDPEIAETFIGDEWRDQDRLASLRGAIEALPTEQQQVIELSYFGGLSQSEIAEHLSVPLGTVKTRMRLGLQKLREAWLED